ncbi:Uncharacterised protein [Halioglobus japonicus]|nr:Uncharacterised protein [Halioglobus japonicus]
MMKLIALAGLFVSFSAHATYFSLSGVLDQSDSFSIIADGITMTIDNPSPNGLVNAPDSFPGLDFGNGGSGDVGAPWILRSFDLSFSETMSLTSLVNPIGLGSVQYSILGNGVASTGNILSNNAFNGGSLLFQSGERYTFHNEAPTGSIGNILGINASSVSVPNPATVWLIGSALLGMGVARRKFKFGLAVLCAYQMRRTTGRSKPVVSSPATESLHSAACTPPHYSAESLFPSAMTRRHPASQ